MSRVGDIIELRETATQRLGRNYTKSSADPGSPKPTSDLGDISKKALDAAAEREQLVSTSDLINTFPKIGDRLTYASGEGARTNALVQAIENGLVPRVADSMSKIQTVVTEAMEQSQTVQRMLQDLNAKQTFEERQIAFMEDIRRQVREAVNTQVGVALKQFGDDPMRRLEEATAEKRTADGEFHRTAAASGRQAQNQPLELAWAALNEPGQRGRLRRAKTYSARSTSLRLSEEMAAAGFSPLGQALVQLRMVWQR